MEQFFDKAKCQQRNRIVAQKEEVEGAPIRFLAGASADLTLLETAGAMPEDEVGALAAINALLPENAPALKADDVYLHYLEAANDSFIGDRYAFLAESTLRNIATDAAAGVSFMNSHRTGSVSTPSELPFGKTFAGQYRVGIDAQGKQKKYALVGFYMLRGIKPNGENGPSTDDLHKMIVGGQVADVSVGLSKGEARCNVCNGALAECSHTPGTRRKMTDAEIQAQTDRGIPGGRASYTVENARMGEVSAVFDGAVPGAGVKKVMLNRRKLGVGEWREARQAFGSLLNRGAAMDENLFDQVTEAVREGVQQAFAEQPARASEETEMAEPKQANAPDPAVVELQAKLAAQEAQLTALQAEKEQAEKLAAQNGERIQKLEADAQRQRFADKVKGWVGDPVKHIEHLCSLAKAFGEDSEQVKFHIEQNQALANTVETSAVFNEIGKETRSEQLSAAQELDALAKKRESESGGKLTYHQAYAAVLDENPALYARYRQEGGK